MLGKMEIYFRKVEESFDRKEFEGIRRLDGMSVFRLDSVEERV